MKPPQNLKIINSPTDLEMQTAVASKDKGSFFDKAFTLSNTYNVSQTPTCCVRVSVSVSVCLCVSVSWCVLVCLGVCLCASVSVSQCAGMGCGGVGVGCGVWGCGWVGLWVCGFVGSTERDERHERHSIQGRVKYDA